MTQTVIGSGHPAALHAVTADFAGDGLVSWILGSCSDTSYLMGHADDGVIWGRVDVSKPNGQEGKKTLTTSHDALPEKQRSTFPTLNVTTLQTLRLFSPSRETLLWRSGNGWDARMIQDTDRQENATWVEAFDEDQMLWGTRATVLSDSKFSLLEHGQEGLRHVVPLACQPTLQRPLKLRVRHYLNNDGLARVVASRLVDFVAE